MLFAHPDLYKQGIICRVEFSGESPWPWDECLKILEWTLTISKFESTFFKNPNEAISYFLTVQHEIALQVSKGSNAVLKQFWYYDVHVSTAQYIKAICPVLLPMILYDPKGRCVLRVVPGALFAQRAFCESVSNVFVMLVCSQLFSSSINLFTLRELLSPRLYYSKYMLFF